MWVNGTVISAEEVAETLNKRLFECQDEIGPFNVDVYSDGSRVYHVQVHVNGLEIPVINRVVSVVNLVERQLFPDVALNLDVVPFAERADSPA